MIAGYAHLYVMEPPRRSLATCSVRAAHDDGSQALRRGTAVYRSGSGATTISLAVD